MPNALQLMPQLEGEELTYIQSIIQTMTDEQAHQFAPAYLARRKDPMTILILTLIGFVGVSGLHRFVLGQVGMGVLYLLTGGICAIGTIIDLVNSKRMTLEANMEVAQQIRMMV